jgi:hypothetical protein
MLSETHTLHGKDSRKHPENDFCFKMHSLIVI